jgi:hypothetical protein
MPTHQEDRYDKKTRHTLFLEEMERVVPNSCEPQVEAFDRQREGRTGSGQKGLSTRSLGGENWNIPYLWHM